MTGIPGFSRRSLLGAALASPVVLHGARGGRAVKIGMPAR